jgi:hypothetical protein
MLAEIFMLKLEAAARAAKLPSPSSQFVPVTLPADVAPYLIRPPASTTSRA